MRLRRINRRQEAIMDYLYALKETPSIGVIPDDRLTVAGIVKGTQISLKDVTKQLEKLAENAYVRPVVIGFNIYYSLTIKGINQVEKVQRKSVKIGFDEKGPKFEYENSETKGKTGD